MSARRPRSSRPIVDFPELTLLPDPQRYTRLSATTYHFEALDSDFEQRHHRRRRRFRARLSHAFSPARPERRPPPMPGATPRFRLALSQGRQRRLNAVEVGQPAPLEHLAMRRGEYPGLVVRQKSPLNLEYQFSSLADWLIADRPVLCPQPFSDAANSIAAEWRLSTSGAPSRRPSRSSLDELKAMRPTRLAGGDGMRRQWPRLLRAGQGRPAMAERRRRQCRLDRRPARATSWRGPASGRVRSR